MSFDLNSQVFVPDQDLKVAISKMIKISLLWCSIACYEQVK